MARVPQVMLTLSPTGDIVAEYPTPNGLRRHVPIEDSQAGMDTIRRILSAQLGNRPSTIGLDAKPTAAQAKHWQEHLARDRKDEHCPWCIAKDLGIDTSESAFKRAKAMLREQRQAPTKRPFNYAGDGSVKVYKTAKPGSKAKPIRSINSTMLDELFN